MLGDSLVRQKFWLLHAFCSSSLLFAISPFSTSYLASVMTTLLHCWFKIFYSCIWKRLMWLNFSLKFFIEGSALNFHFTFEIDCFLKSQLSKCMNNVPIVLFWFILDIVFFKDCFKMFFINVCFEYSIQKFWSGNSRSLFSNIFITVNSKVTLREIKSIWKLWRYTYKLREF